MTKAALVPPNRQMRKSASANSVVVAPPPVTLTDLGKEQVAEKRMSSFRLSLRSSSSKKLMNMEEIEVSAPQGFAHITHGAGGATGLIAGDDAPPIQILVPSKKV